jgi:predicted dehydrogenase
VSQPTNRGLSRRELLKKSGQVAAVSALAAAIIPQVHAGENHTIQVALVGCGGRGTGAADNALSTKSGPTKLVAMADVFTDRLASSYEDIKRFGDKVDVEGRKFIGFSAYKKAMDCLKPGDVVILATPPAFRWVHFTYAIQKGLNVFMEKPIAVDGPSTQKMLKLGEVSVSKGLKVGVGLMCRHCAARHELYKRIKDGQLGDILLLRAYRMAGETAKEFAPRRPDSIPELHHQIRWFHSFLWASGGAYSDFLIHNIDECCWMKDDWPVAAKASGGRHYHYHGVNHDQNFDTYNTEYTFRDGTKLLLEGRTIDRCFQEFASYAHGTKGAATISTTGHTPAYCRIFKGQNISRDNRDPHIAWRFKKREPNPYQVEWDKLIAAIRQDQPYNEVKRGAQASLVTAMGRMAAHTGQVITYDQMLNCEHEFAPDVDKLTLNSPAPLRADKDARYPVPEPGIKTKREF